MERLQRALILLAFLLSSCTTVHNPNPGDGPINPKRIVGLSPKGEVTLTNGADRQVGTRRLTQLAWERVDGDLWEWTEAAISWARREIEARGGVVSDRGANELILEVVYVQAYPGQWTTRGVVELRVEHSPGRVKTFRGDLGSVRALPTLLDAALRAAVSNMLSDPEIQRLM